MKKLLLMAAAVALLGVTPATAATFTLDDYTISAHATDPGLVIETQDIASRPTTFDLNVGETHSFDLFRIWTDETDVEYGEDTQAYPINVGVTFSQPGNTTGNIEGNTEGNIDLIWLLPPVWLESGSVTWNGPALLSFGTTGLFSVWLDDAEFNQGLYGLSEGWKHGATIRANVKYLREDIPAAVPEPASMLLLGSGLAAAAAYRRRRAQKASQA